MSSEYHDIHSDFINLNATQSIHLVSNSILINDLDIVLALKQLSGIENIDERNNLTRIGQLESNTNTLLQNYSHLQQNYNQLQQSFQTDISNIKTMMQSQAEIFDNNLSLA